MQYILLSFFAGVLTVFSPCVFTLLPVILGGSLESTKYKRAVTIILSLMTSIFVFTLLLKASTVLINVSPLFWTSISGGILIGLGIITLFPNLWSKLSLKLGLQNKSDKFLEKGASRKDFIGDVLVGAALGPVFSSCSPTYAIILATVLPTNLAGGVIDLLFYVAGLGIFLFLISIFGQKIIKRFKWAVNPNGLFKKILGIIFIIIGLAIITGFDKQFETYLLENGYLDITKVEINLLNNTSNSSLPMNEAKNDVVLNVDKPYPAPEFKGITNWINTEPLTLKDLKGKVVLVDFWTYSCINCLRTLPYLKDWYSKYKDDGLVIVGVHAPEFSFEKVTANVQGFVTTDEIKYPVAQDNDFKTWVSYANQYWPAEYFIDKSGNIVHTHFGEGEYDMSENVIRKLLGLNEDPNAKSETVPVSRSQSPETYLGYKRGANFLNKDEFVPDLTATYKLPETVTPDYWGIGGSWKITEENVVSQTQDNKLVYNFSAKNVYLVMGANTNTTIKVKLNGKDLDKFTKGSDVDDSSNVTVKGYKLYTIINLPAFQEKQKLELTVPKGVTINAFTFGS